MNFIRNFFRGWNVFEVCLISTCLVAPIIFGVCFSNGVIEICASCVALVSSVLLAKGKVESYFLGFVGITLFTIVCLRAHVYGEVIVQLCLYLPVTIYGIYSWARNKRQDNKKGRVVVIRVLHAREFLILITSQVVMGVGYFFMLRAFDTEYVLVSTLSLMVQVTACYMVARRSRLGFFAFIVGDIVQVVLWSLIISSGNTAVIAILVTPCLYLVNDIYGIFEWRRLRRTQVGAQNINKYVKT